MSISGAHFRPEGQSEAAHALVHSLCDLHEADGDVVSESVSLDAGREWDDEPRAQVVEPLVEGEVWVENLITGAAA